ncbi:MAG: hypothetical protein WBG10_03420 [Pseudolabrys sp.]|jgi:hypothetical protein
MPANIATLTAADFEPHVQDEFQIASPTGEIAFSLKLVEVHRLGRASRPDGAFSLLFLSPPGPFYPQATYPLTHATLGTLDLFLVPLGPTDGGNRYEAVFT